MERGATDMIHAAILEPFRQVAGNVTRAIVGEQSWAMGDPDFIEPGSLEGEAQRVGDVLGLHRRAQLPGDDVAREVVEHRG